MTEKFNVVGNKEPIRQYLRKFMRFEYFKDMIDNGYFYFNRIDNYDDKYEGLLPPEIFSEGGFVHFYKQNRTSMFVTCFTKEDENFERMFKTFTPNFEEGLFFRVDIDKFRDSIIIPDQVFEGHITYFENYNQSQDIQQEVIDQCFKKRSCFDFEKEYRFIYTTNDFNLSIVDDSTPVTLDDIDYASSDDIVDNGVYNKKVELSGFDFIEEILLHPKFDLNSENSLRELLRSKQLDIKITRLKAV